MPDPAVPAPVVVVTGVSTGIGHATVIDLLDHGFSVFGSVRSANDSRRLSTEFAGRPFTPLIFDVTNREAIRRAAEQVGESLAGRPLAGLVNNAGMTGGGPLLHQPAEEVAEIVAVNGVSPLVVSQAFLPLLGARRDFAGRPGRIVNISSVGGRLVAPFAVAYQAGKHALEAISDGLRRELMLYGIDVVVIEPGATRTAIWDKTEALKIEERYAHTDYAEAIARFQRYFLELGRSGFPPSRVAEVVRRALTARRPKARYAVLPKPFLDWHLPRMLPDRILDRAMAGRFGLRPLRAS